MHYQDSWHIRNHFHQFAFNDAFNFFFEQKSNLSSECDVSAHRKAYQLAQPNHEISAPTHSPQRMLTDCLTYCSATGNILAFLQAWHRELRLEG